MRYAKRLSAEPGVRKGAWMYSDVLGEGLIARSRGIGSKADGLCVAGPRSAGLYVSGARKRVPIVAGNSDGAKAKLGPLPVGGVSIDPLGRLQLHAQACSMQTQA